MFLLFWTGWGILVPVILGVVFVLTQLLVNAILGPLSYEIHEWPKVVAMIISVVSIWFVGKYFNSKPGREFIDKKTGQEIVVKPNNTLFFIKMEYWAIIILVLSIIFSFTK